MTYTNPVRPPEDQTEFFFGLEMGIFDGFFFGRIPKKKRNALNRLTSRSYNAMIRANETKAMIRYFGPIPMFQRITNQPTQRIIV